MNATAVVRLVLSTAAAAEALAVYGIAAVEAVPAEPQEAGTDGDHRDVVWRVDLSIAIQTRTDHCCCHEPGDTG